ncbi:reverse transcriptase domain-containing protein, partial [Tanacetum coccineum]
MQERNRDGGNRNGGNGNGGNGNGENGNGENGNGGNGNDNGVGNGYNFRGFVAAQECRYQDFLKCQPLNFNGTEGVVGLTRWFERWKRYSTLATVQRELMKLMIEVYCPRNEVQKMETELWNLAVKGNDLTAYTRRFQELVLLCTRMVPNEEDKVERFVGGLPDNIQGNVIAAEPTKLQDAIRIANNLMDQKLKGYARSAENKRRLDNNPRDNRGQQPVFKRQNVGGQNVARAYTAGNNEKKGYVGSLPYCNKCKLHHAGPCTMRCGNFPIYGYDYMKQIVLRRADNQEYTIAENDFKDLYPSDFEDLYLLNLQGHLNHLPPRDRKILSSAVNLWIRNLVIRQRVEDFQLGIESYQTQLNLTKPRWEATGLEFMHDYKILDSLRAVLFRDKYGMQMLMRFNEIHKFSDGTLQQIDEALDYRVKEFKVNKNNPALNTRTWKALLVEEYAKETTDFYGEPNDDILSVASRTSCV